MSQPEERLCENQVTHLDCNSVFFNSTNGARLGTSNVLPTGRRHIPSRLIQAARFRPTAPRSRNQIHASLLAKCLHGGHISAPENLNSFYQSPISSRAVLSRIRSRPGRSDLRLEPIALIVPHAAPWLLGQTWSPSPSFLCIPSRYMLDTLRSTKYRSACSHRRR